MWGLCRIFGLVVEGFALDDREECFGDTAVEAFTDGSHGTKPDSALDPRGVDRVKPSAHRFDHPQVSAQP